MSDEVRDMQNPVSPEIKDKSGKEVLTSEESIAQRQNKDLEVKRAKLAETGKNEKVAEEEDKLYELYEIEENKRLLSREEERKKLVERGGEHIRQLNGKTPEEWAAMEREASIKKAEEEIAKRQPQIPWWQVWK